MTAKTPEQLVSVYGDMVYRLAYAQTRSRHDADDIFQEVFLQTVRKRPVFDSVEHEKAWLLRVTLNCLKSHWRMAWRRHDTPLDDRIPFPEPEDSALDEALRRETEVPRGSAFILLRGLHRRGDCAHERGKTVRDTYTADTRTGTAARIDERRAGRWIFTSSTAA